MPTTRLVLRDAAVSWTPTDDGQVVVLDMRTSRYLSLNRSAATLWTLLANGATRSELVDNLVSGFDLPADRAEKDVDVFIDDLRERDLLDAG